jgi:hypothetical protein
MLQRRFPPCRIETYHETEELNKSIQLIIPHPFRPYLSNRISKRQLPLLFREQILQDPLHSNMLFCIRPQRTNLVRYRSQSLNEAIHLLHIDLFNITPVFNGEQRKADD